jgi:hypothetical protein
MWKRNDIEEKGCGRERLWKGEGVEETGCVRDICWESFCRRPQEKMAFDRSTQESRSTFTNRAGPVVMD